MRNFFFLFLLLFITGNIDWTVSHIYAAIAGAFK